MNDRLQGPQPHGAMTGVVCELAHSVPLCTTWLVHYTTDPLGATASRPNFRIAVHKLHSM